MADNFSEILAQALAGLRRRALPRRARLLDQGQVSQSLFLVESGCLRLWHVDDDGVETTLQFFLEGEIVGSLNSLFGKQPSPYGIDAVIPSIVRVLPRARLFQLLDQDKGTRDAAFGYLMRRLSDYQSLFLDTIRAAPQQRHALLKARNPQLFALVPQHYIASYLGITPVSLSRIRKKAEALNKG